jgi:hypothetical protein
MGYVATEMLIRLIEGDTLESDLYEVPMRLIVRDSCRAVADHAPMASGAYDGEPRAVRIPFELRIRESRAGVDGPGHWVGSSRR